MKTRREGSTNDSVSQIVALPVHRATVAGPNHLPGSITDMYPVTLDGGKTVIFISDKSKEAETRQNYELRKEERLLRLGKKFKERVVEQ
ncbi:MAG: hypothetical protein NTW10_04425 [Bacteroidetes bacterium]|nr:hypothetical protein [Bacteroidota bacterium]